MLKITDTVKVISKTNCGGIVNHPRLKSRACNSRSVL